MNASEQKEIGRLEARVDNMETDVREMRADVREIRDVILQAKGSWKTLVMVSGASAAIGALVAKLAAFIPHLPR